MCSTDFEPCEVWNRTLVKRVRKARNCYECGLFIPVGAPAARTFYVFDGSPHTVYVHFECEAIADFIEKEVCRVEGEDGEVLLGGLDEEVSNIREYLWALNADDADACEAMGFAVEREDGQVTGRPVDVVNWIWDLARERYREPAGVLQ